MKPTALEEAQRKAVDLKEQIRRAEKSLDRISTVRIDIEQELQELGVETVRLPDEIQTLNKKLEDAVHALEDEIAQAEAGLAASLPGGDPIP